MDNLEIYNKVRDVPAEAKKNIQAGRLKGMTDINPMWRIKLLTEHFGVCGFGWKYEIVEKRLEKGAKDQISAFVDIHLFVKIDDKWSESIPGTGGSSFVTLEKSGLYQSDECFKMALTDAISVACKSLGFGADVYWNKDKTKYDKPQLNDEHESLLRDGTVHANNAKDLDELRVVWDKFPELQGDERFKTLVNNRKKTIQNGSNDN